ncbi:MAG: hypothetical protein EAZ99_14620 [Alphaproteobacteria bacterium]|nr:MAG: hypothetical protein EAZ99_14620 [Alphaproteobacteria bacterium]
MLAIAASGRRYVVVMDQLQRHGIKLAEDIRAAMLAADEWNAAYRIGTVVTVNEGFRSGQTATKAFVSAAQRCAVVQLAHQLDLVPVSTLTVLEPAP